MWDSRTRRDFCLLVCAAQMCWVASLSASTIFKSEPFLPFARNLALAPAATHLPGAPAKTVPVLYVYDHCPFCTRVRLALGLKKLIYELRFLANDDVKTPTELVGKKIAPIFALPGEIDPMPESMDIIRPGGL